MSKVNLLSAVKRVPWRAVGRQILLRSGFDVIPGKSETIAHAMTAQETDPRFSTLAEIVAEMLSVSEKSVRLYKITGADRNRVQDWIDNKRRASNPLTLAYPGVAAESVRRTNFPSELTSLGKQEMTVGVDALFTGVREYLEREEIPLSDLRHAQDFERVYGQRRVFWQTFSCLWLPGMQFQQRDILVSLTDQPEKAPKDFAGRSHDLMVSELRRGCGVAVEPLNLFSSIQNIYSNNEGSLLLHGFVNNAEAVKYHRGRRDLRKDAYDIAGAAAVGSALQPFRVGVKWKLVNSNDGALRSTPQLQILGTSRLLTKPQPTINEALVGNCVDSTDMQFVIQRLIANI